LINYRKLTAHGSYRRSEFATRSEETGTSAHARTHSSWASQSAFILVKLNENLRRLPVCFTIIGCQSYELYTHWPITLPAYPIVNSLTLAIDISTASLWIVRDVVNL